MARLAAAAVASLLLLAGPGGRTHAYLARAPLPRLSRGVRSLTCNAPLIEATACQVLRLVLKNGREAHVSCSVQSDGLEVLQGRVRGATVRGRGWASRLGLTARTVLVNVGGINLDMGALFRRRVLEFRPPAPSGDAIVVFNEEDFGNFLAHKLVGRTVLAGRSFAFDREEVCIDPSNRVVAFGGRWGGRKLRIALSQASARANLAARVVDRADGHEVAIADAEGDAVALAMSDYFNGLEIDLDGPTLRFSHLSFEGRGVRGGRLKLSLRIVVRKLPSIRAVASF